MSLRPLLFTILVILQAPASLWGAEVGKQAAMKYFTGRSKASVPQKSPYSGGERLFALSLGSLINNKSYHWMDEDFSGWNLEAFYQNSKQGTFARGFHLEFQKFSTESEELTKIAFLMSLTFPRRLSFPVFVGVAAGPGFFLNQKDNESDFSFDYKGYLGLRFSRSHSQYFLQTGVKNHVHVLSDGQFIGWFISSGVAYKF